MLPLLLKSQLLSFFISIRSLVLQVRESGVPRAQQGSRIPRRPQAADPRPARWVAEPLHALMPASLMSPPLGPLPLYYNRWAADLTSGNITVNFHFEHLPQVLFKWWLKLQHCVAKDSSYLEKHPVWYKYRRCSLFVKSLVVHFSFTTENASQAFPSQKES